MKRTIISIMLAIIVSLFSLPAAQAQSQAITNGLSYLTTSRNSDTSWGNGTSSTDPATATAYTLETLAILGEQASPAYIEGRAWLATQPLTTTAHLALRMIIGNQTSTDTNQLITYLDNTLYAWGGYDDYEINILDTALAVKALKIAAYPNTTITGYEISRLTSYQNTDGGWGFTAGAESSPYLTALVCLSLEQYAGAYSLGAQINKALDYLLANQHDDGSIGETSGSVHETALALEAFFRSGAVLLGNPALQAAHDFILASQAVDGSWNQDPFDTALALRALYQAIPPPPASIVGTVKDSGTLMPLQDVAVKLTGLFTSQTITLADGAFAFSDLAAGAYSVTFTLNGYQSLQAPATLTAGQNLDMGAIVLTLVPAPATGLKGTVTDFTTGLPIAGALIAVNGASIAGAVADDQGDYYIEGLQPGGIVIVCSAPGYMSANSTGTVEQDLVLTYSPILFPEGYGVPPDAMAAISGVVVNSSTGAALKDVNITASFGADDQTAFTAGDGGFLISGPPVHSCVLSFSLTGYEPLTYIISLKADDTVNIGQVRLYPVGTAHLFPDLMITHIDTTGAANDPLTLELSGAVAVTVANNGETGAQAHVDVIAFFDSNRNGAFDPDADLLLGQASTATELSARARTVVSIPVSGVLPYRDAPIKVWVDSQQSVVESNEGNNVKSSAGCYSGISAVEEVALNVTTQQGPTSIAFDSAGNLYFSPGDYGYAQMIPHGSTTPRNFGYATINDPDGVVVDSNDNVIVSGNPVIKFAPDGRVIWQKNCPTGNIQLVTVDKKNTVYVGSLGNQICKISEDGATLTTIGNFYQPSSMAIGPDGLLYVVQTNGNIVKANPETGAVLGMFISGLAGGQPVFDDAGNFYVGDFHNHGVVKASPDGTRSTIVSGISAPYGLDFDPDGILYAGDNITKDIYRLNPKSVADLTVSRLNIVDNETSMDISVRVGNAGSITSPAPLTVAFYQGNPAAGGLLLGTVPGPALGAESFIDLSLPAANVIAGGADIYALVDLDKLIDECNETNNVIAASAPKIWPDLTISNLMIVDNGAGTSPTLQFRAVNNGRAASPDQVLLAVYNGDPSLGKVPLGSTTIPALASKGFLDAELPVAAGFTAGDTLYAVIDADDRVPESEESNNIAHIAVSPSTLGKVVVSSDRSKYGPNGPVSITARIDNSGALPGEYLVVLSIEDSLGVLVADLGSSAVGPLASGATVSLARSWNTGNFLTGAYVVRANLTDRDGAMLAQASSTLSITPSPTDDTPLVTLRTSTDKSAYGVSETVNIANLVQNRTSNSLIDAFLNIAVNNSAGSRVFSQQVVLGQIVPGGMRDIASPCRLANAAPGSYLVASEVVSGTGTILASTQVSFEVRQPVSQSLKAEVRLEATRIERGQSQTGTVTLTNRGSQTLTGIEVRNFLATRTGKEAIAPQTVSVDLASGQSRSFTRVFDTSTLANGYYDFVVQVRSDGPWQTIGYATFLINSIPIANAGPDQRVVEGNTYTLDGSASTDKDGDPLTYSWSIVSAPAGSKAALVDDNTAMPRITVDLDGLYEIGLTVNDGYDDSSTDTVILTVTDNIRPVANAGPDQTAHPGATLRLDGSASSDADGDALLYEWIIVTAPPASAAVLSDPYAVQPKLTIDSLGTYEIQLVVDDGQAESLADTVVLTSANVKPVANAGPDQSLYTDGPVRLDGSASHDADGDRLSYSWSVVSQPEGSSAALVDASSPTPTLEVDVTGLYILQLVVNDGYENSAPDTVVLNFANVRPVAEAGANQTIPAGATAQLDGSASYDANDDLLSYFWSIIAKPDGSQAWISDPYVVAPLFIPDYQGTYIAQLIVNDGNLESLPDTVVITVTNQPPVLGVISAPLSPVPVNTSVCSRVGFTDPGAILPPSTNWEWGDGNSSAGTVSSAGDTASIAEGCHSYTKAGVYVLRFTLTDDGGETVQAEFRYLVVYDPNGGFVTGGGWINSPAGACPKNPGITGKANFGFNAQYQKGGSLPTGSMEFNFKEAGMNFHALRYYWLVVVGAKAQGKGVGTVNGKGGYGFMLSVLDGEQGGGADKFRIKIWEEASGVVLYDNQMGAADNADASCVLGGGSIEVHKE